MIKLENTEVIGWEHAIRGMRNPKNSWDRSDSFVCKDVKTICPDTCSFSKETCPIYDDEDFFVVGKNDHKLMTQLAAGGPVHAKYRRMIAVYVDITAPLYWWKEFDTYKVGTVANSCSTMHKIHDKEFTLEDFSTDHLFNEGGLENVFCMSAPLTEDDLIIDSMKLMHITVEMLNEYRERFIKTKDKKYWWQMIQLLPSSYNQKRTVMLNYEVLAGMYRDRKHHKLDEWRLHDTPVEHSERNKDFSSGMWGFCDWIESLPYSEIIIGEKEK